MKLPIKDFDKARLELRQKRDGRLDVYVDGELLQGVTTVRVKSINGGRSDVLRESGEVFGNAEIEIVLSARFARYTTYET